MRGNCRSLSYNCTLCRHRTYAPETLDIQGKEPDGWFRNVSIYRHQPDLAQICRNRKRITHFRVFSKSYTIREQVSREVKMATCYHTLELNETAILKLYLGRSVSGATRRVSVSCVKRLIRYLVCCLHLCCTSFLVRTPVSERVPC